MCVYVCVPASISVKIFHLQFKSMARLKAAAAVTAAAVAQKSMQQKYENLSWPEAISQFARNSQLN